MPSSLIFLQPSFARSSSRVYPASSYHLCPRNSGFSSSRRRHTPTTTRITPSSRPPPYPYDYPYLTIYNPDLETVSFLDRCTANVHRQERLAAYKADIKAKANLTLVCRAWSVIAQDLLYEFVWISSGREGRALAERLCGAGVNAMGTRAVVTVGTTDSTKRSGGTGTIGRIWKSKGKRSAPSSLASASSSTTIQRKSSSHSLAPLSVGRFIKRPPYRNAAARSMLAARPAPYPSTLSQPRRILRFQGRPTAHASAYSLSVTRGAVQREQHWPLVRYAFTPLPTTNSRRASRYSALAAPQAPHMDQLRL